MGIPRTRQHPRGNIYLFRTRGRTVTFEMLRAFSSRGKNYLEGIDCLGGALCMLYPLSDISGNAYHPDSRRFVSPQALAERYWVDGDVPPTEWNLADRLPFPAQQMWPLKREGSGFRVPVETMMRPRKRDSFKTDANLRLTYREFGGGISDIDVWIDRSEDGDLLLHAHCPAMDNECYATLLASRVVSCIDLDTGEPVEDVSAFLRDKRILSPAERLDAAIGRLGDLLPVACYVGRASGQLRKPKRELLRAAIRRIEPHEGIDDAMIDSVINNRVAKLSDDHEARAAIDRIAANPRHMAGLYKISRHMMAAGKEPAPAELAILEYMAGKLEGTP